jgi:hypothetical protein
MSSLNFSEFIEILYKGTYVVPEDLAVSTATHQILGLNVPLYGEVLGIELDILNRWKEANAAFYRMLFAAADEIKALTGHGELTDDERIQRTIDAMKNYGMYSLREDSNNFEFDASLIKGHAELLELTARPYDHENFLFSDAPDDLSLRILIFENLLSWQQAGVKGDTADDIIKSILSKRVMQVPGSDRWKDINPILETLNPTVYKLLSVSNFVNDVHFAGNLILFTRCGIGHNALVSAPKSQILEFLEVVSKEFAVQDTVEQNVDVVEDENAASAQADSTDEELGKSTETAIETSAKPSRRSKATSSTSTGE